jgi:hypothetical protein
MIYVALASLAISALLLVVHFALIQVMRGQGREHARREGLLLNQMLNLAGRPWQPPPSVPSSPPSFDGAGDLGDDEEVAHLEL